MEPRKRDFSFDSKKSPNLPIATGSDRPIVTPTIENVLPHEKMYVIQIGDEAFKLSGASLSYDSPSYFTEYFLENPTTTVLHLDRSPKVFEKIYMHLQGYSIQIENDYEFIYLLLDANYFRLRQLKERILQEGLVINVGGKLFKLPKDILGQKGNYPNFFSVIYNSLLLDPFVLNKVFIRPPPITPNGSNRSAEIFQELLNGLYGNAIEIRNEQHRENLLNDCRYYQFSALEQKIINHKILKNPFTGREEIVLGYQDVKKSNLLNDTMDSMIDSNAPFTVVKYSRPFVDKNKYRDLVLQIDSSDVDLMVNSSLSFASLLIFGKTALDLKNLLTKVTDDYIYETEGNSHKLTVIIRTNDSVGNLNGLRMERGWLDTLMNISNGNTDYGAESTNKIIVIKLLKSQWTINVQGRSKIWMNCLKFEGVLDRSHFNDKRDFL